MPAKSLEAKVRAALQRTVSLLLRTQRPGGDWDCPIDMGSFCTSQVLLTLHYVGQLSEEEKTEASKWLRSQQRDDGSYVLHPSARKGHLTTTAVAWGALRVCGASDTDPQIVRAWKYIQDNGGLDAVIEQIDYGDLSALFLAMAGFIDPFKLQKLPIFYLLSPRLMRILETKVHAGILMQLGQIGVIVRRLRGDYGPDGMKKGWLEKREAKKVQSLLEDFQNEDGSWNCISMMTAIAAAALHAIGVSHQSKSFQSAIQFLKTQKIQDQYGIRFIPFMTGVWSTAFNLRALLMAGVPRSEPKIQKAVRWLVDCQCKKPMPVADNRKPNAVLTGGWPFEKPNDRMPDSDDAAVVLSALCLATKPGATPEDKLPDDLLEATKTSIEAGFKWLFDMQNPDGGWQAYVWNLGKKKPGPFMTRPIKIPSDSYLAMAKIIFNPPPELGDPATEDVTGRALHCMGEFGYEVSHHAAQNAIQFLKEQRCDFGPFWGRWATPYLPTTAFALSGMAHVGVDMKQDWIQEAITWTLKHQNKDGGWGEDYAAYREPSEAGKGYSMPPVTGLVLYGLIESGLADTEAVEKGIRYLVSRQRPDGTWINNDYLHSFISPDLISYYAEAPQHYGIMALASYLTAKKEPYIEAPIMHSTGPRWNDTFMDKCRTIGDPLADEIVDEIFKTNSISAVNQIYTSLMTANDQVPEGFPPKVTEYFNNPSPLPVWIDWTRVKRAQITFTKFGWEVASGLFCSSLPQAYCAGKGAHALFQTHSMLSHQVKRRVFETAQFMFDTMDINGLDPAKGPGIRAAQKVRLMHATIRRLLLEGKAGPWDTSFFGIPINQEDLAGTLMTFSCLIVDALRRFHIDINDDEAEDWVHTWNAIGHVMGLDPKMLPRDYSDGENLIAAIRRRHWSKNQDGIELMKALNGMMQDYFPGLLGGMPVALVRYLAGDHCADLLGLPPSDWNRYLIVGGTVLEDLLRRGKGSSRANLIDYGLHKLMEGIANQEREGKKAKFRLPESLRKSLGPDN